jgi:hypothetical protein
LMVGDQKLKADSGLGGEREAPGRRMGAMRADQARIRARPGFWAKGSRSEMGLCRGWEVKSGGIMGVRRLTCQVKGRIVRLRGW